MARTLFEFEFEVWMYLCSYLHIAMLLFDVAKHSVNLTRKKSLL